MPPVNALPSIATCTAAALLLAGCSIEQRVKTVSNRVETMYAETKGWQELPKRTITWQQALDLMLQHNLDLKKAQNTIEDAERESLSVYTDMIPGMSYYGYLTTSLDRLSDVATGEKELNSNVNVSFSLPALTQVPYRVYSAKVQTFAAIKAREGKERELISQLYQATRQRDIAARQAALDKEEPADETAAMKKAREARDADTKHWLSMAKLIGDAGARWEILPQSLPRIRWEDYAHRLDKLDPLVVCNYAMQMEQARMAQYGIALRYLPTVNTSLYSPSLFSSSGGTYSGTFLSGEDTRINLSISYTFDTDLRVWNTYQRSKEQYELACRNVADSLREHKGKVDLLRQSVAEYDNWRRFMQKRIQFTEKMTAENATQYIEREKSLLAMRKELLTQEAAAVESEAALILQYGLPGGKSSTQKP